MVYLLVLAMSEEMDHFSTPYINNLSSKNSILFSNESFPTSKEQVWGANLMTGFVAGVAVKL